MAPLSMTLVRRTGMFSEPTPEKCAHYAKFLEKISRQQADAIFWSCFIIVLLLLVISSSMFTRAAGTLKSPEFDLKSRTLSVTTTSHRRIRYWCLIVSTACFFLAVPCIILEAFAAFHIQFCGGEDLMMLYWAFWTLLQVGSMMAMLGIALNQCYGINARDEPPWATALGTPVLVFAAIAHYMNSVFLSWRQERRDIASGTSTPARGRSQSMCSTPAKGLGEPLSSSATMVSNAPDGAKLVGYTTDDEPLYMFAADTFSSEATPYQSRRTSHIDPLRRSSSMANVTKTPSSRSPEREVKFAEEVKE